MGFAVSHLNRNKPPQTRAHLLLVSLAAQGGTIPLSCIFCDHIKRRRNKPSFTYVTAYCANDRYSTRTSRPLFSSFKNSLTHLLGKKKNYGGDTSHALPQKATVKSFWFSTTNLHRLKGKRSLRKPRLYHTRQELSDRATKNSATFRCARIGDRRHLWAFLEFCCLRDLREPLRNFLKKGTC